MAHEMRTPDGTKVTVEHVKALPNGGARFDVEHADGRRWRIDVTRSGNTELVTSWLGGQLADLEEPDWIDDVLAQLQRVA